MNWNDPAAVGALCGRITGVGVVLSAVELMVLRASFDAGGLFSWRVTRTAYPVLLRPGRRAFRRGCVSIIDAGMRRPAIDVIVGIQLVAGIFVVVAPRSWLGVPLVVAALSAIWIGIRLPFGRDGSDQVRASTLAVLALAFVVDDAGGYELALWFLCAQLLVSYLIAAIAKLLGTEWRSGDAIGLVLRTRGYGMPVLAPRVSSRGLGRIACWSVIALELSLAAVLVIPDRAAVAVLVAGMAFHAGAAVLMGLNTFFWSYVGLYPAVWFCHEQLAGWLA